MRLKQVEPGEYFHIPGIMIGRVVEGGIGSVTASYLELWNEDEPKRCGLSPEAHVLPLSEEKYRELYRLAKKPRVG